MAMRYRYLMMSEAAAVPKRAPGQVERDEIRSVIPGVIRPVRDAKGAVKMHITVPVTNGWKAIALASGARQELFISTPLDKKALEALLRASGAVLE